MFSGLIAYRGTVESLEHLPEGGTRLRVRCEGTKEERPQPKDSIAIDGVCLTATSVAANDAALETNDTLNQNHGASIVFDVVPETLERSTLSALKSGDLVNVEYSLKLGDRIGGHFVYGHVDATAKILSKTPEGQGVRLRVKRPKKLAPMLTEKAFVAIDGVSVTIANAKKDWFELALIPETLQRTTLGSRNPGDVVNIEVDPIARYVQSIVLSSRTKRRKAHFDFAQHRLR